MKLIIQQYINSIEHLKYRLLVNATLHSGTQNTNKGEGRTVQEINYTAEYKFN